MRMTSALGIAVTLLSGGLVEASGRAVLNRRIGRDQTVAQALHAAKVPTPQVEAILAALSGVFDCRRSRVGDQLRLVMRQGEVDFVDYRQGPLDEYQVRRDSDRMVASKRPVEVEKKVAVVELAVDTSLYEAARAAGEDPTIAMVLADVFAWDIDFYRDVQRGDKARAVVEKVFAKGRLLKYGDVLAAAYQGSTVGAKRVFRYALPDGTASYFQPDGSSARKTFLKSPLKFANITSRFGSRLHPVLQYVKAHNGVDYGTPVGTPVWAVADGTVTRAGWEGGGGKTVCIRHTNGFETCYLHLSQFGQGVRVGARVQQKQIIAYSGNTGMSTGPHLHFALKRGGQFVNPLNQNFPRAEPLPTALRESFVQAIAPLKAQLEAQSVAAAPAPGAAAQ